MKKVLLLCLVLFLSFISLYAQETKTEKKYDYLILLNKHWETPRVLQILYPDGHTENFATLEGNDSGENLNKNLATLLQAFNFLGNKGYQLTDQTSPNETKTYIRWQYIFKRELE